MHILLDNASLGEVEFVSRCVAIVPPAMRDAIDELALARIGSLDAAIGNFHWTCDHKKKRIVGRRIVDRFGDVSDRALDILLTIEKDRWAITISLSRAQNAIGVLLLPLWIGLRQDAVVIKMNQVILHP